MRLIFDIDDLVLNPLTSASCWTLLQSEAWSALEEKTKQDSSLSHVSMLLNAKSVVSLQILSAVL